VSRFRRLSSLVTDPPAREGRKKVRGVSELGHASELTSVLAARYRWSTKELRRRVLLDEEGTDVAVPGG